ncbi:MAG: antitoxin HicB [Spirochaetota bacterium]|nr:antitoxin HicB [Spirochaetota bacterium]
MKELKYKNYIGTVNYSKEDACYFGIIKKIKDSVSYEGYTKEELEKDFQNAVEDYIAFRKEHPEKVAL